MGAPVGNQNAAKSRVIYDALRKAIVQDDRERIAKGVQKVLDLYEQGDRWAHEYVRDTLDGRPSQSVDLQADMTVKAYGWMK